VQRSYHARNDALAERLCVTLSSVEAILPAMVDDLLSGRVTSFRREQGFGVITLDDGRDVKFDASDCTMVPEEGAAVRLRVGPARWGGGIKALHVEPKGSSTLFVPASPPTLDEQIAALQREHLVGALSEQVMALIMAQVTAQLGGQRRDAALGDVLDAFYTADAARARHDGYVRFAAPYPAPSDALPILAAAVPGIALPRPDDARSLDELIPLINRSLETARDPRRLFALDTGADRRAYIALPADRAKRLARVLPFR
jgi:cold shock CspA family protein